MAKKGSLDIDENKDHQRGKNYLLVIAIDKYTNKIPTLNNCVKDAKSLRKTLTTDYQFEPKLTRSLFNEKATRKNIFLAFKKLKEELSPKDNLLIYFSGHGANIDEIGYWIPVDGVKGEEYDFISTSSLIDRLNIIPCHHLLVIVDACFSGKIFQTTKNISLNDSTKGYEKRASRYGFSASHSREVAFDGEAGENSPFAKHLLKKLESNKKPISIGTLANHVIDQVDAETEGEQSPVVGTLKIKGDDQGQFVLHPKHLYYKFEDILELVKLNEFDLAREELQNFCLLSKKLPEGYEYLLCTLVNVITRYNHFVRLELKSRRHEDYKEMLESKINFNLDETLRSISGASPSPSENFEKVLNLISKNKIIEAIGNLQLTYKDKPDILIEIISFNIRFNLITKYRNLDILMDYEFENLYSKAVDLLLVFLKLMDSSDPPPPVTLATVEEHYLSAGLEDSINLFSELTLLEYGKNDLWYLAKMLQDRAFHNKQDYLLKRVDLNNYIRENNKITAGLLHLFKRTSSEKGKVIGLNLQEELPSENLKEFQSIFIKVLTKRDPEKISTFLIDNLSPSAIEIFRIKLKEVMEPIRMGIIDHEEHISRFLNFSRELLKLAGFEQIKTEDESEEKPLVFSAPQPMSLTVPEKIIQVKTFISQNEIMKAFELIKTLDISQLQSFYLEKIELKYKLNEEDRLFSRKDENMLDKRDQEVVASLLNMLNELE